MLQTLEHVSITLDIARNLVEVLETAQERLGLL
jgi:hypothetical protein